MEKQMHFSATLWDMWGVALNYVRFRGLYYKCLPFKSLNLIIEETTIHSLMSKKPPFLKLYYV